MKSSRPWGVVVVLRDILFRTNALTAFNITHTKSQNMTKFFVANVPTTLSDEDVTKLLEQKYSNISFQRFSKKRNLAFLSIPTSLVNQCETLTKANTSNDGTPLSLPSCPPIYLRPCIPKSKRKHIKSSNLSTCNQLLSNEISYADVASKVKDELIQQHDPKIQKIENQTQKLMVRVSELENEKGKMQEQITNLTTNINNLTTTITTEIQKLSSIAPAVSELTHIVNQLLHAAWPQQTQMRTQIQTPATQQVIHIQTPTHQTYPNQSHPYPVQSLKRSQPNAIFSPIVNQTGIQPTTHITKKQRQTLPTQAMPPP